MLTIGSSTQAGEEELAGSDGAKPREREEATPGTDEMAVVMRRRQ